MGSSAANMSRAPAASPASPVQRARLLRSVRVSGCPWPDTPPELAQRRGLGVGGRDDVLVAELTCRADRGAVVRVQCRLAAQDGQLAATQPPPGRQGVDDLRQWHLERPVQAFTHVAVLAAKLAGFGDVEVDVAEPAISHPVNVLWLGFAGAARHAGMAIPVAGPA